MLIISNCHIYCKFVICTCKEECTLEEYKCKSGACIPSLTVCDETPDCPDGDDEEDCTCARNEVG